MKQMVTVVLVLLISAQGVWAHGGLFDSVPGEQMTECEMEDAEGEGVFKALLGGAIFGSLTYLADCLGRNITPTWEGTMKSAAIGAVAAVSPAAGALAGLGVVAGTSFRIGSYYIRYGH